MAYNMLIVGKVEKDVRSDDDDSEGEGAEVPKKRD
jgi:hypothetical protein